MKIGDFEFGVVRLTTDGIYDSTFGIDGRSYASFSNILGAPDDAATAVALDAQGRIIVAGLAYTDNLGSIDFAVARLQGDSQDPVDNGANPLGQQLVDFALARLGQQVGDGECGSLVDAALKAVGAPSFDQLGPTGPDADYVWGTLVAEFHPGDDLSTLDQVQPGDIIQFRDVHLEGATPDGGTYFNDAPHHTALVEANNGGGNFTVLEQNVNGERFVHEDSYHFADMTQGTIWIYRPIAQ
jgi:hypothetical protein